jgi:hypothetical protein
MSNVTNVIVLVSDFRDGRLLDPFSVRSDSRRWHGAVSRITGEDADRYWVHDGKGSECHVWVGAFNHFNRKAFLDDLQELPWENPAGVQVLIEGQDDDCWGLWMFTDGRLQEVSLPCVIRRSGKSETLEGGQWIQIETGCLERKEC